MLEPLKANPLPHVRNAVSLEPTRDRRPVENSVAAILCMDFAIKGSRFSRLPHTLLEVEDCTTAFRCFQALGPALETSSG